MDAESAYRLARLIEHDIAASTHTTYPIAEVIEVREVLIHTPDGYTSIEDVEDWEKKRDAVLAQYEGRSGE